MLDERRWHRERWQWPRVHAVRIKERQHLDSADTTAMGSQAKQRIDVSALLTNEPTHAGVSEKASPLIGQQILPRRAEFSATVVGGLSGIDCDAKTDSCFIFSDDRTTTDSRNAPRFYKARLRGGRHGLPECS